jgi:hypothetical protein
MLLQKKLVFEWQTAFLKNQINSAAMLQGP